MKLKRGEKFLLSNNFERKEDRSMISKITENNKELIIARIKEINEAFKAKAYKDAIAGGKTEEQAIAAQNDAL